MWKESLSDVLLLWFIGFASSWMSSWINNMHHGPALCFQLSREMPWAFLSWTRKPIRYLFSDFPLSTVWEREGLLTNYCHGYCCCYQPLPWGWANGTSGTFSLNLGRGEMGGVRSLRREEAGGTGASSEGLRSAVGGGKWHSYTCWVILMHSRILSIIRLPKINGQFLELSVGAFICLQLQLFL